MSLQGIKLVTFDATNTLLKFRIPPWHFYTIVARDHGFKGSPDDVKTKMKDSFKLMWEKHPNFGKDTITWEGWWRQLVKLTLKDHLPASADVATLADTLINEFKTKRCWCIADGGDNIICSLRKQGVSVGIISNFDPRLDDILKNLNLHDVFEFILTSYKSGFSKPDKRIFEYALKLCKQPVEPNEALHIGDDLQKDYEGARSAGWHALLVTTNLPEKPPAKDHVFNNLEQLSLAIEQKNLKL
ncbi:haloacid dehalogenase-like hydrolase domain-containing protein 3 [Manduca sexta]|uniref:Rhythmically expressed gene 2 protein n=1 Tax=Manduca sexta TaxID=7130 RepID=A0A922CHG5_MANSE|nr:haloacid dehalogenase-like hydrolase domain-containing protein 3 [Manduca sexta]KAG6446960.1 hypothetical protein O3G_MSEX004682 [Manduca sexta]